MSRSGGGREEAFTVVGHAPLATAREQRVAVRVVSPDYFATMGIPLLQGRSFDQRDRSGTPHGLMINQALAERFWPAGKPLDDRVLLGADEQPFTVVGIVSDTLDSDLETQPSPEVYLPLADHPRTAMSWVARTTGEPEAIFDQAKAAVYFIDADQPVHRVAAMDKVVASTLSDRRLTSILLMASAILALVLAAGGLYGVMSYSVARRRKEIGIRMSMGARPGSILRLILEHGVVTTLCGIALGALGALGTSRLLASTVFGTSAADPAVFAVAAIVLLGVGLLASYLPARRAAALDPAATMRS